jgi:hypothetical protein
MRSQLHIGICARNTCIALAAVRCGGTCVEVDFPATPMGVQAIKRVLDDYDECIRLAVTGRQAIDLALALGNVPNREAIVVLPGVAERASDLARFLIHVV